MPIAKSAAFKKMTNLIHFSEGEILMDKSSSSFEDSAHRFREFRDTIGEP
jgi:hypothetical protein